MSEVKYNRTEYVDGVLVAETKINNNTFKADVESAKSAGAWFSSYEDDQWTCNSTDGDLVMVYFTNASGHSIKRVYEKELMDVIQNV